MSESYTIGGDTWQPLAGFDISAQTFTPLESHIVNFIDLNLWLFGYTPPNVSLWKCDSSHEPLVPILATAHVIEPLIYLPPAKVRARFQLDTPVSLEMGTIYAIWIRRDIGHAGPNNQALYDKDDATYPRGHIIFSDDGGHTWTHFNNHDFIFAEFGNPPLPKPVPVPPIAHFAVLDILKIHLTNAIVIRMPSNVPCHLTCYYTDKKPLKHHTERIVRGLAVPWGTYFCFVAWKSAEQIEPGDTLYHTFIIPDWSRSQTKWFTFRGEVDTIQSLSIGPIFKHQHPGQNLILNPGFEDWSAPAGDAPDHWEYPPAPHHNLLYLDPTIKVEGDSSCRCDGQAAFGNYYIWQDLTFSLLNNIPLTFTMDYRGKDHFLNNILVRAEGDTIRQAIAFPSLDYTWETLSMALTLPSNITRLYIRAQNFNQGFPLPYQTWWDNCQVLYTP